MAGLPLYLMAIPLRKSLAAGMDLRGDRLQKLHRYRLKRKPLQRRERGAYMRVVRSQLLALCIILSVAKSKDPATRSKATAPGFLDFARNARAFTATLTA